MAENVEITPGSGDTVGADDIGGVKFQRIKIIHGANNTNDGDVATGNPLPVVQTGTPGLPSGAATAALQTTLNGLVDQIEGYIDQIEGYVDGLETSNTAIQAAVEAANVGYTPYKLISGSSTNGTNVKNGAGKIGYIYAINLNAAVRYLKIYNKASSPTVGSDTPVHTFPIPASTTGAGFVLPKEINLSTGISFAITTGAADSDTGAVAANEIIINLGYK